MFRKISTRIIASVVAGGAAVVVALTALHMRLAEGDTRELAGKQLYALVSSVADDIDARIRNRLQGLAAAAYAFGPVSVLTERAGDDFLNQQPTLATMFDNLLIYDRDGRVVADRPHVPGRRNINVSDRDYFIRARDTLKPCVSEPFLSKVGNKPLVNFAAPLFDEGGRFAGVLSGTLELLSNDFIAEIRNAKIGETGYFIVMTRGSALTIVHPKASRMMAPIPPREKSAVLHRAIDGWNGWDEGAISDGTGAVLAYRDLKTTAWLVGGVFPTDEAYASLRRTARWVAVAGVAATLLLSLLVWAVIGRNLAPLHRLREQMDELRAGHGERAIDLGGPDEVRRLALAFNDLDQRRLAVEAELRDKEAFHRILNENSPLGIFVVDAQGHCTYVNDCYEQLVGRGFADIRGRGWTRILHPDDVAQVKQAWAAAMGSDGLFDFEHRYCRPDGGVLWVHVRARAMETMGQPVSYLGVVSDITAQMHWRHEVQQQRARAESLVEAFQDSMLVLDARGDILDLSPAAEKLTGWTRRRVAGVALGRVLPLLDEATGEPVPLERFFAAEQFSSDSWLVLDGAGVRRPMDLTWVRRQGQADGSDMGGILMLRDAGRMRETQRRLSWEAAHDSLTGLMNRRGFTQTLQEAWGGYRTEGRNSAVLMLDLDGFKQVNDLGGHIAGDEMLRKVAACIESTARATDCAARLGGDEFALLLPGCSAERAVAIAASLCEAVRGLVVVCGDMPLRVSTSVGCSKFAIGDGSSDAILLRADAACYRVKSIGRDGVDAEWAPTAFGAIV